MPINAGAAPAIVSNNIATKTTASFTPASSSLLVACISLEGARLISMSNSGTALTWTLRQEKTNVSGTEDGYASIFTAPAPSGASLTVTATLNAAEDGILKVYSFTGVDLANPVGQGGIGYNGTLLTYTPTLYTSSVPNSRAVGVATNYSGSSVTIGSGYTSHPYQIPSIVSGAAFYANADTPSPAPVSVTMSATASRWAWAAIELLPPVAAGFTGWGFPVK
ncbi:hypothetical protein AB0G15_05990 [Streptosporangium sp. NPDC023825]|uniref:hypothetical protein n=1 Tax=Streptosporangium sp. NPDC023825 TaxID=3154909 RepID=UPI00343B7BA8